MTKLVKKLLISLMAIVMTACLGLALLGTQPITANAATAEYDLWVSGVNVTSDNLVIDDNDNSAITGTATYDAENNMIIIAPGSYFNIGELFFASTSSADLNSNIGYGYLVLNADKTQIQQPYAFYTAYFNPDNSMGAEDAYAGGVVYTKVAE